MIFVILGMHKSGTTMISQILHKSGINMGQFDESISYDNGNQYERYDTQLINMEIIGCGEAHSLDVISHVKDLPVYSGIPDKIKKLVFELDNQYSNWGFKDPRTSLSYSVWEKCLPPHKVIYIYRDPLEIWHHYRKYIPRRKVIQRIKQGYKALRAWQIHNCMLLKHFKENHHHSCILNFSDFMESTSELNRLSEFVGIDLIDCREKSMYRSKPESDFFFKVCATMLFHKYSPNIWKLFSELNYQMKNNSTGNAHL